MIIEDIPISAVKPYEKNPRKNDKAVDGVAESIKQFGFKQPIVIDKNGVIVAGHTRYKAALKLGFDTVPCVRADDLTQKQIKAYRILDNKLNELASWDFEMLGEELETFEFDFEPFDVEIPTFDWQEFTDIEKYGNLPPIKTEETVSDNTTSSITFSPPTSSNISSQNPGESPESTADESLNEISSSEGDEDSTLDRTPNCKRLVISYPEERSKELAEFFGLQSLEKEYYDIEEILD